MSGRQDEFRGIEDTNEGIRSKRSEIRGLTPRTKSVDIISKQLSRAATSVGANYRAACKGRSKADFISKITVVEEEADETQYWLELLIDLETGDQREVARLLEEAKVLTAIFTASGKTAKRNR